MDLERMERALNNAAKAGDVDAARQIAKGIRQFLQQGNPSIGAPKDMKAEAAKMAAEGMGTGEAMAVSAGRTMDKGIAGVRQVMENPHNIPPFYSAMGFNPAELQQNMRDAEVARGAEQKEKDVAFGAVQQERPFASAIGGAAPYFAVPPSMGVLAGAGTVGALEGMQYGTPQERMRQGAIGGVSAGIGGALGRAAGGLLAPVSEGAISGTRAAALKAGDNLGIRPRLSETTGSQFLARMEDMAARTPGGAGVMDDFARTNQQNINRAGARTIGETADELSPSVFASASDRLGKVFEDIKTLPGRPIQFTQKVGVVADDIIRQQGKMIAQQQDENLLNLAKQAKTLSQNKGRIDGESYQLLRSGLSEASFDASGTNRALYGKLLESIDDAAHFSLKSSGNADLADALKLARPQYGNLKTLERGLVSEGGDVSPARLAQVLRQKNPGAFREGRGGGELQELARFGETFKPLRAGSPTYEREAASDLLGLLVKSPLAWSAAHLTTSPLIGAYPRLLAMNPGAARIANQGGGLLTSGVRGGSMGLLGQQLPYLPIMSE